MIMIGEHPIQSSAKSQKYKLKVLKIVNWVKCLTSSKRKILALMNIKTKLSQYRSLKQKFMKSSFKAFTCTIDSQ